MRGRLTGQKFAIRRLLRRGDDGKQFFRRIHVICTSYGDVHRKGNEWPVHDMSGLARSARESFEIIELWRHQKSYVWRFLRLQCGPSELVGSSDNPLIQAIRNKITEQGTSYYQAIQKSVEIAPRELSFTRDAIGFWMRLLRAEDSFETLKSELDDVQDVTKTVCRNARDIYQQFKDNRVGLFKVRFSLHHTSLYVMR